MFIFRNITGSTLNAFHVILCGKGKVIVTDACGYWYFVVMTIDWISFLVVKSVVYMFRIGKNKIITNEIN